MLQDSSKDRFFATCFQGMKASEKIGLVLLALIYLVSRAMVMLKAPISSDEAVYCLIASKIHWTDCSTFLINYEGKGPFFFWLIKIVQYFVQDPVLSGRLVVFSLGFFALPGLFALTRLIFNVRTALLVSALFTLCPLMLIHGSFVLLDYVLMTICVWGLALLIWIFPLRHPGWKPALGLGCLCTAALEMKITGLQLPVFALLSLPVFIPVNAWGKYWRPLLLAVGCPAVIYLIVRFFFLPPPHDLTLGGFYLPLFSSNWNFRGIKFVWFNNASDFCESIFVYWGTVPFLLLFVGIVKMARQNFRMAIFLVSWSILHALAYIVWSKFIASRYFLPCAIVLIIFTAEGAMATLQLLDYLLGRLKKEGRQWAGRLLTRRIAATFALVVILYSQVIFFVGHLRDPLKSQYSSFDQLQFVSGWTNGSYFSKLCDILRQFCAQGPCNIIVMDQAGLLRDGVVLYKDSFRSKHVCSISPLPDWEKDETVRKVFQPNAQNVIIIDNDKKTGELCLSALQRLPGWQVKPVAVLDSAGTGGYKCKILLLQTSPQKTK